jgi:hypothetical protein
MVLETFLWKPLLEASAQTIVGAIGSFAMAKVVERALEKHRFDGPLDFWMRGLHHQTVSEGDQVYIDGLISPYTQLFPSDPFDNARKWRKMYEVEGQVDAMEYQALDFYHGADAALRIGSLNGESLVGIYARYGYVGEGIIAVASTKQLLKSIPDIFHPDFSGAAARIGGIVSRCPTQHGYIIQGIAAKAGINVQPEVYRNLYYLKINKIQMESRPTKKTCSLLGSPWAVTEDNSHQYIMAYGHFNDKSEILTCTNDIKSSEHWNSSRVYFDEISALDKDLSFTRQFIK